jgi:hypothetical protein
MSVLNRRNALLGWVVWQVGKRVAKQKARAAVPSLDTESRRPNRAAVIAALAALGLGAWALSRRNGEDADEDLG